MSTVFRFFEPPQRFLPRFACDHEFSFRHRGGGGGGLLETPMDKNYYLSSLSMGALKKNGGFEGDRLSMMISHTRSTFQQHLRLSAHILVTRTWNKISD